MSSLNRVMLMGNLTRDPVLRNLNSGSAVGEFAVAMTEYFTSKEGARDERVCFVDIVVWNAQAKACAEHLQKGARVLIEGKLQFDEWTDKTTGDKKNKLRVRADRVHFVGSNSRPAETSDEPVDDVPPQPPAQNRGRGARSGAASPEPAMRG